VQTLSFPLMVHRSQPTPHSVEHTNKHDVISQQHDNGERSMLKQQALLLLSQIGRATASVCS